MYSCKDSPRIPDSHHALVTLEGQRLYGYQHWRVFFFETEHTIPNCINRTVRVVWYDCLFCIPLRPNYAESKSVALVIRRAKCYETFPCSRLYNMSLLSNRVCGSLDHLHQNESHPPTNKRDSWLSIRDLVCLHIATLGPGGGCTYRSDAVFFNSKSCSTLLAPPFQCCFTRKATVVCVS